MLGDIDMITHYNKLVLERESALVQDDDETRFYLALRRGKLLEAIENRRRRDELANSLANLQISHSVPKPSFGRPPLPSPTSQDTLTPSSPAAERVAQQAIFQPCIATPVPFISNACSQLPSTSSTPWYSNTQPIQYPSERPSRLISEDSPMDFEEPESFRTKKRTMDPTSDAQPSRKAKSRKVRFADPSASTRAPFSPSPSSSRVHTDDLATSTSFDTPSLFASASLASSSTGPSNSAGFRNSTTTNSLTQREKLAERKRQKEEEGASTLAAARARFNSIPSSSRRRPASSSSTVSSSVSAVSPAPPATTSSATTRGITNASSSSAPSNSRPAPGRTLPSLSQAQSDQLRRSRDEARQRLQVTLKRKEQETMDSNSRSTSQPSRPSLSSLPSQSSHPSSQPPPLSAHHFPTSINWPYGLFDDTQRVRFRNPPGACFGCWDEGHRGSSCPNYGTKTDRKLKKLQVYGIRVPGNQLFKLVSFGKDEDLAAANFDNPSSPYYTAGEGERALFADPSPNGTPLQFGNLIRRRYTQPPPTATTPSSLPPIPTAAPTPTLVQRSQTPNHFKKGYYQQRLGG
ncbi:uncharacterized protein JCM6883_001051 [Sporobolomyces salmoneus]|uniref:uncharacterized protein n=1 Tax=Sporobolomyces salmoneus TaxID=183962 RepID=UPI00316E8FCB